MIPSGKRRGSSAGSDVPTSPSTSNLLSFPRASSPVGFQGFLTKSARWLGRTTSTTISKAPQPEPRPRLSSSTRRPTISGPSDPRPILAVPGANIGASQSVLDLSQPHGLERIDDNDSPTPSELGDIGVASSKSWSRSMDDLSSFASGSGPNVPAKSQVDRYRNAPHIQSPLKLSKPQPPIPFPSVSPQMSPTTPSSAYHNTQVSPSPSSPTFTYRVAETAILDPSLPVHARSKSHGAHHPHAVKPPLIIPPTTNFRPHQDGPPQPRRTNSNSQGEKEKDKPHSAFGGLSNFPFHFGASSSHKASGSASSSPFDTPTLQSSSKFDHHTPNGDSPDQVPATPVVQERPSRNSQIIHCTGFVNRFALPSKFSAQGLSNEKAWKPYKAQLVGSKLYLYKPPADRSGEIKSLFLTGPAPVEIVPKAVEPAPTEIPESGSRSRVRDRKRTYWGRARHAELVMDADDVTIVGGTADALAHEVVFATTFKAKNQDGKTDDNEPLNDTSRATWDIFSRAVMLCVPVLFGKAKFEAELIRDVNSFDRGAAEEEKAAHKSRLQWLLNEYVKIHGKIDEEADWDALITEQGLDVKCTKQLSRVPYKPPSTPPARTGSPNSFGQSQYSPNGKLGSPLRPIVERGASGDSIGRSKLGISLTEEGLTRDIFMRTDPRKIADSLALYNRTQLRDIMAINLLQPLTGDSAMANFCGTDEQPHWLTRLVMDMILSHVGKPSTQADADTTEPGASATKALSTAHVRAGVLTRWVQIGERCRVAGDVCSWGAISAALCSVAVARLEKVWRRVDDVERLAVENWVRVQLEEEPNTQQHTPWIGERQEAILDTLGRLAGEAHPKETPTCYTLGPLYTLMGRVDRVLQTWNACLEQTGPARSTSSDVNALLTFWPKCSAEMSLRGASTTQMLSMSHAIESRRVGHYQPNFWKPAFLHNSTQPIIPLLFPETLPTVSLLDRNTLLRSKKENLLGPTGVEVQEASVQKFAQAGKLHSQPPRNIGELDLEETLLPCFNGELILKMPKDDVKSRPISVIDTNANPPLNLNLSVAFSTPGKPPSRGNSIRLSPAARLERKSSQTKLSRRSSLPSISQRNSLVIPESDPSDVHIRVLIKRGTLDRLVDVLISGLEVFGATHADDHGEMPLREGKGKIFEVDRAEYAALWWNGFRSFVTPFIFFELLRKRYLAASIARGAATTPATFISPSNRRDPASNERLCLDILGTMRDWLTSGSGTQDILDDIELYQSFKSFLSSKDPDPFPDVEQTRTALRATFITLTARPPLDGPSPLQEPDRSSSTSRRFGSRSPNIDTIPPDDLVHNLDSIAKTISKVVSTADLFELADILETQTADRTGWYGLRDYPPSNDEQLPIQDLYGHLQMIEPSPFVSQTQHDQLVRILNPSIRNVVRTHNAIRDWLIFKITEPNITPGVRLTRLELLVNALDACRSNTYDGDPLAGDADIRKPVVRSFVEAALVSAIVSPESRIFARSWNDISHSRGQPLDTLLTLIGDVRPRMLPSKPLTVDLSWVMERLLEIITLPDLHDSDDGQTLINIDKRRFINNVIVNSAGSAKGSRMTEVERQDLERLSTMTREAHSISHDFRVVRETALREIAHVSLNQGKRLVKPFQYLVYQQQEKLKRDKYIRDRLLKEKKTEQLRSDKRVSVLNRAMQPAQKTGSSVDKHLRQKRSVSGMYSLFRPLSVAFGGSMDKANSWEGPPRTAEELDFSTHSTKPAITLNLVGAGVRNFINDSRPYTLQIDTEDGGHFLLQALASADRDMWLNSMKKVADLSALKRLTYMGNNPLPELIDFSNGNGPDTPNGVFGHDILTVLRRENPAGECIPGAIPRVVELCISEIERRGITEVGIYRISGSKTLCNALRRQLDAGQDVDLTIDGNYPDIYVLADVLRQWFRELPESVFTNHLYNDFIETIKIPDYDERKIGIRTLIWQLPQPNFDVLRRLMEHLDRVVDVEDQNQMSPDALAICFNVTLCRPPSLASFNNMQQTLALVKHCIIHYHYTFSDSENDPEADEMLVEEPRDIDDTPSNDLVVQHSSDPNTPLEGDGGYLDQEHPYIGSWLQASQAEPNLVGALDGP